MAHLIERQSFSGLFDQSFRLMRGRFLALSAGYVAVDMLVGGMNALLNPDDQSAAWTFLELGLTLALWPLADLTATIIAIQAYVSQPQTYAEAFGRAKALYVPYLGTLALWTLSFMGLFLLLIVPAVYFGVLWALIAPIAAVENVFGGRALRRSRALLRGYFWRAAFPFALTMLIGISVPVAVDLLLASIPLAAAFASGLVEGVLGTFVGVFTAVLYIDMRVRHEDFDLELLAGAVARDRAAPAATVEAGVSDARP